MRGQVVASLRAHRVRAAPCTVPATIKRPLERGMQCCMTTRVSFIDLRRRVASGPNVPLD